MNAISSTENQVKPNLIDAQTARKLLQKLDAIEEHGSWFDDLSGPRSVFSKKRGYLTGLATLVAMLGLKWMGISENWFMVAGLPLIVFFIVKKAVYAASKRPTTWRESIDRALTEWVPFDKMAYRSLQQETKELGYLDNRKLRLWVLSEREAIKIAAGYAKGPYEFSLRTTIKESI